MDAVGALRSLPVFTKFFGMAEQLWLSGASLAGLLHSA